MSSRPFAVCLALLAACARSPTPDAPARAPRSRTVVPRSKQPLAPPRASLSAYVDLAVAGFGDAVVALPDDLSVARPLVIVAHGNYDRPDWQCRVWRDIVRARAFVLCPRGVRRADSPSSQDSRFTYASAGALAREIDAARTALRARYPNKVDDTDAVFAGFSLGAIQGASVLHRLGGSVAYVVMVEGAADPWTPRAARDFAAHGGRGVLFGCGQSSCAHAGSAAVARLRRAGVPAEVAYGRSGHTYWGAVARAIQQSFTRMTAHDPRFARE